MSRSTPCVRAVKSDSKETIQARLSALAVATWNILLYEGFRIHPGIVVIEDLPRNAMGAGITGQARGAILSEIGRTGTDTLVLHVPPATLKKAFCGKGNGKKEDMLVAAAVRYGSWILGAGMNDDMIDALALYAVGEALVCGGKWRGQVKFNEAEAATLAPFASQVEEFMLKHYPDDTGTSGL